MRALRSTKFRKLPSIHVIVLLLLSAAMAPAQPGDRRSPGEIRRELNEKLDQKTELIQQYPDQASSYLYRGEVYAELSRRPRDDNEREFFTDRALADFDMAIELNPNHSKVQASKSPKVQGPKSKV